MDTLPLDTSLTLAEKISDWNTKHAADFPDEVQALFAAKTQEVLESGILAQCIHESHMAPDFSLPSTDGTIVRLREKLQHGPAVLSFYRGTWCPYCNLEFRDLLDTLPQYRSRGAVVLALSPQMFERNPSPCEADFEDLLDRGNEVAKDYGLVYSVGEDLKRVYAGFGIHIDTLNDDRSLELPIPATYIIDRDSRIRYASASADPSKRAEPNKLVEILSTLD